MKPFVPSVVQAFAIIRALADGSALTLSEVAQRCGISPSSCLGLLRTLVAEGVLQPGASKRYSLAAPWSAIVRDEAEADARLVARARPMLEQAAREWQAPVGLWRVASRDRLQLVALGESMAATRIHMEEGQRQPIGSGSVGRALAAAQDVGEDELRRRFGAIRWQKPVAWENYAAQVRASAAAGHARDIGLTHAGVASLAAVVPGAPPRFCVSVSVFDGALDGAEMEQLATGLKALATRLAMAPAGDGADAS